MPACWIGKRQPTSSQNRFTSAAVRVPLDDEVAAQGQQIRTRPSVDDDPLDRDGVAVGDANRLRDLVSRGVRSSPKPSRSTWNRRTSSDTTRHPLAVPTHDGIGMEQCHDCVEVRARYASSAMRTRRRARDSGTRPSTSAASSNAGCGAIGSTWMPNMPTARRSFHALGSVVEEDDGRGLDSQRLGGGEVRLGSGLAHADVGRVDERVEIAELGTRCEELRTVDRVRVVREHTDPLARTLRLLHRARPTRARRGCRAPPRRPRDRATASRRSRRAARPCPSSRSSRSHPRPVAARAGRCRGRRGPARG